MTASATYYIKSVGFTPSGGSLLTIDGLEEVTIRQNGQVVAHMSDGVLTIQAHFIENLEAEITCRSRNGSLMNHASVQPGVVGSLVVTMQKRAAGKGPVAGQDKTITAANAMVGVTQGGLGHGDRSTFEAPFHCSDPAGSAVLAFG